MFTAQYSLRDLTDAKCPPAGLSCADIIQNGKMTLVTTPARTSARVSFGMRSRLSAGDAR
jgi:hypothetical protein